MSNDARAYLLPPYDTFWQWADQGEVVSWRDGKTIAFRDELAHVLRRLAPGGLPPFGAVVLLMAAVRNNWRASPSEPGILSGMLNSLTNADAAGKVLVQTLAGLGQVNALDDELRSSPEAKAAIAEMVFEGLQDRASQSTTQQVVEWLERGLGEEVTATRGSRPHWSQGPARLLHELRCLGRGLDRVDSEKLRLRLQTGLDEVPQPVELDLPPAERVRALLAELADDPQLQGLAKLAGRLMAAVSLPRGVSDHEVLPVGGFSDISNRGSLDRLLISELAQDDLTLAVRLATNEALYLRRESSPETPPRGRMVLLDAGIRSWGVPRVFATAVALALAATADPHGEVAVFRAKGDGVEPVDLTTRTGLVEHLEALETDLHPGNTLAAFERAIAQTEYVAEPVLVTTEDVVDDRQFQRALGERNLDLLHVATVNRRGNFRLTQGGPGGRKTVREALLDLDGLFAEPTRVAPMFIDREAADDLPAIFSVAPFPLLLSHGIDPHRMWPVAGQGVLMATRDRRLLLWTKRDRGARQLAEGIPGGAVLWHAATPFDDRAQAVVGQLQGPNLQLLDVRLGAGGCSHSRLGVEGRSYRCVCGHNGILFAVGKHTVDVFDTTEGQLIQCIELPPGMNWQRDRFFRGDASSLWHALSHDGRTARFELVLDERAANCPQLLTLFECEGFDGPIGVTLQGDLYATATRDLHPLNLGLTGGVTLAAISADGRRVVLRQTVGPYREVRRQFIVDVETFEIKPSLRDPGLIVEPVFRNVCPVPVRNRFTNIHVDSRGSLNLTTRKQLHLGIEYDAANDRICMRPGLEQGGFTGKRLTFKHVANRSVIGYGLTVATWDDGSRAFLDSRGLLHLKSSDPQAVPETTIVLGDGEVSGWCADGRLWGRPYALGDHRSAPKREVFETAIDAFVRRLR